MKFLVTFCLIDTNSMSDSDNQSNLQPDGNSGVDNNQHANSGSNDSNNYSGDSTHQNGDSGDHSHSNGESGSQNSNQNSGNANYPDDVIVSHTLDSTIVDPPVTIHNEQGTNAAGSEVTISTMVTDPNHQNVQVNENLVGDVTTYDDTTCNKAIVDEIRSFAQEIKCTDFHGKGTIDDYSALFQAASQIANESKQMQLDIDVDGFNEFGQAADELSQLFSGFIVKLQNINIINDTIFLTSVRNALQKIVNLSNTFGKFKETILATSTLKLPASAHDTRQVMEEVMSELDCAMNYITYFVAPTPAMAANPNAQLSDSDKNVINSAVQTIHNWNILCEEGVSVSLSSNPDLQYLRNANTRLKNNTSLLKHATDFLKTKFSSSM